MANVRTAQWFVDGLERIDAELRERMARLDMGDIGDLSGSNTHTTAVGCGLCFEPYDREDRPDWLVGEFQAQEHQAVGIPCPGHHVVHASCLRDWFATVHSTNWTCPFCRAPIDRHASRVPLSTSAKVAAGASGRSVREQVRHREREQGWRCDAPTCLPRYPDDNDNGSHRVSSALLNNDPKDQDMVSLDPPDHITLGKLYTLSPCHHEIHLECLMTTLRIVDDLPQSSPDEAFEEPAHHSSTPYRLASVPPTSTFDSPPTRVQSGKRCGSGRRSCCGSGGRRPKKCTDHRHRHRSRQRCGDHGSCSDGGVDSFRCGGEEPRKKCSKLVQLLAHLICIRDDTGNDSNKVRRSHSKSYVAERSESEREALITFSPSAHSSPITTKAAEMHCAKGTHTTPKKTEHLSNVTWPGFKTQPEEYPDGKAPPSPTPNKIPSSMFVRTSKGSLWTVGRWIKCPTCRKEVWTHIPPVHQGSSEHGPKLP